MIKSLAEARTNKWNAMKRKSTQRIPPDQESHDLKVTRVNYQVYTLRHYHAPPSPLNHGWHMSAGLCTPMSYIQPTLPQNLNDAVEQRRGAMTTNNNKSDTDESSEDTDSEEDF